MRSTKRSSPGKSRQRLSATKRLPGSPRGRALPRAYAEMFAPTSSDYATGVRLFTGERVSTRVGIGHTLGEESCRALLLLRVDNAEVAGALKRASRGMLGRLAATPGSDGMYCCRTCSSAMWRHLAAGGLDETEARLTAAMKTLKSHREANGR